MKRQLKASKTGLRLEIVIITLKGVIITSSVILFQHHHPSVLHLQYTAGASMILIGCSPGILGAISFVLAFESSK